MKVQLGACKYLIALCFLVIGNLHAQVGNEWIKFDQAYFKIQTAEDAMYRATYSDLQAGGFPVNSIDPRRIQLFHRGTEQAILFQGQNDGSFDPGDYFEFYGQRNDGTLDAESYFDNAQPHAYYNIYSDTTAYFLTVNNFTNGKRMNSVDLINTGGLSADLFHLEEQLELNTNSFNLGLYYLNDTHLTDFDFGEGWTGSRIGKGQTGNIVFENIDNRFESGPKPKLEMVLAGRNGNPHTIDVLVGGTQRILKTIEFTGYTHVLIDEELEWSDISSSGTLVVSVFVNNVDADFVSISSTKLSYPQELDMQGNMEKVFRTAVSANDTSYIEIKNAAAITDIFDLTDPSNVRRIEFDISGSLASLVITGTSINRKLLVRQSSFLSVDINKVNFRNINPGNHNYLIVSNKVLRQSTANLNDPVQEFAKYRASAKGGGYDTIVVNMSQLYDQFSYGEINPVSIRHFAKYMFDGGDPEFLFLVGKGLSWFFDYYRNGPVQGLKNLVPTYGFPGSDISYTAGFGSTVFESSIATGRYTANNPEDVENYLNKVIEMEAVPFNELWRKRLLHLSGGRSENELLNFRRFSDEFKVIAELDYLGGSVLTQSKTTTSTTELINAVDQVNEGLSMIMFFGHSAPSITDIDIGFASDPSLGYSNKARYPMILVNGCDAGNIFSTADTFGEDWMRTSSKGSISFMAHSATGLSNNLRLFSNTFYSVAFADSSFIDLPLGKISSEVSKRYMASVTASPRNIAQAQQMVLQGDPAVRLFGASKPDYETNNQNLFIEGFNGETVDALSDSFKIGVIVRNFGRTVTDSLVLTVRRTYSDGSSEMYQEQFFDPVRYQDTLYYRIDTNPSKSIGNNNFEVSLDPVNLIPELNENNNTGTIDYFIFLSGTTNLSPYQFSIVNSQPVKLVSQASDIFGSKRDVLFEIDTTYLFNSGFKKAGIVPKEIIANYSTDLLPDVISNDSIVYYWRTKFANPQPGESTDWSVSSFIYIKNSQEGWSQSKFPQFRKNEVTGLIRDNFDQWQFLSTESDIAVVTYGNLHPNNGASNISVRINGFENMISFRYCRENSIALMAFDKSSTIPYAALSTPGAIPVLDKIRCGTTPPSLNNFIRSEIEQELRLEEYIDNVSNGDYVLLFTIGLATYDTWPASTKTKLQEIGVTPAILASLENGEPYIVLGRKGAGAGNAIKEIVASIEPNNEQELSLNETIFGNFSSGQLLSPRIGPAKSWNSFHKKVKPFEIPQTDVFTFDIYGLDNNSNETLLESNVIPNSVDIATIDASLYPYLKLKLDLEDEDNLTPVQLDRWQILYEPAPEGILLFGAGQSRETKELQEGSEFSSTFIFHNISDQSFIDSLQVKIEVFNSRTRTLFSEVIKIEKPAPGDSTVFNVQISTLGKAGLNDLTVFVNPLTEVEQNYNNNVLTFPNFLNVKADEINPILDVSIDGAYILNGDVVSANPLILTKVIDENKILLKQDTLGVELFIKLPGVEAQFRRINFSDPEVTWLAANENKDFQVEYRPRALEDGLYTFRAQAVDASGNESGVEPYSISFEIINESSITNFYPYPNPFSTSTRFVFTLTGGEIPDQIRIRILTVSGKVVREINQDELGPIRVGNNLSEYAWDGRDEYGDQLANGVYLYKVDVRMNGELIKQRETSADKAFKKGFGKMYLLR